MGGLQRLPISFSYQEIKNHLLSLPNDVDRFMLACSYANGTRISEIIGLRAEDIAFDDNFVYIQTPVAKKRRTGIFRAPPISRKGEPWLTGIILTFALEKEGKLIPYSKRTAQRRFQQYFDCTSHSFRHTRATHCFRVLGMSIEKVGLYFRLSPRGLTDWIMRYGHLDNIDLKQHLQNRFKEGANA